MRTLSLFIAATCFVALKFSYANACGGGGGNSKGGRAIRRSAGEEGLNYAQLLDGVQLPALKSAFRRSTLKGYDSDNDGILSAEENQALLVKASEYFDETDVNADGELNPKELQAFVLKLTGFSAKEVFTPQEQKKMFTDLDKDGDGALSRNEMAESTLIEEIVNFFKSE